MAEKITAFACSNMGLAGADVYIEKTQQGFEARQCVSIFGSFQMPEPVLKAIDYNPFHADFNDNYVSGKGDTKEAALKALQADAKVMADSLWI